MSCRRYAAGADAPRRCPEIVLGDRGYEHDKDRRLVRALGVKPVIARRATSHGSGLGTQRRLVDRWFAHLRWSRRLRIRWEIRDASTKPSSLSDAHSSAGGSLSSYLDSIGTQ